MRVDRKQLMTTSEAARHLGVSKPTLLRWAHKGEIENYTKEGTKQVFFLSKDVQRLKGMVKLVKNPVGSEG